MSEFGFDEHGNVVNGGSTVTVRLSTVRGIMTQNLVIAGGENTGSGNTGAGLILSGGLAGSGGGGGDVVIAGGGTLSGGSTGQVIMPSLPTSDPVISGALYISSGVVKVSTGID